MTYSEMYESLENARNQLTMYYTQELHIKEPNAPYHVHVTFYGVDINGKLKYRVDYTSNRGARVPQRFAHTDDEIRQLMSIQLGRIQS